MTGPTTTTMYLKRELGFTMNEWKQLTDQDKKDLRDWAAEEMAILGIK